MYLHVIVYIFTGHYNEKDISYWNNANNNNFAYMCFIYVSYIAWLSQEIILVHNCNKIFIALHVLSELLVREKNVPVLLIFGKSLR